MYAYRYEYLHCAHLRGCSPEWIVADVRLNCFLLCRNDCIVCRWMASPLNAFVCFFSESQPLHKNNRDPCKLMTSLLSALPSDTLGDQLFFKIGSTVCRWTASRHYVYEDEVSDDCWSCNRTACKSEPSFVLIWRHQKHKDFAYCDIGSRVRLESEPLMYQASASRENSKQFNAVKK